MFKYYTFPVHIENTIGSVSTHLSTFQVKLNELRRVNLIR